MSKAEKRKQLLFTSDVMVFALVGFVFFVFCTSGWFPKTEHNELMLPGRMNVSTLFNGKW